MSVWQRLSSVRNDRFAQRGLCTCCSLLPLTESWCKKEYVLGRSRSCSYRLPMTIRSDGRGLQSLRAEVKRDRRAKWVDVRGIGLDESLPQQALCHSLTRCGMGYDLSGPPPETVVLDWSGSLSCSAEGVAFFAVLAERLASEGVRTIVGGSDAKDICLVLRHACQNEAIEWVDIPILRTSCRFDAEVPTTHLLDRNGAAANRFCDELGRVLAKHRVTRSVRRVTIGAALESIQNINVHAQAGHATASVLFHHRRRPQILQIGLADDGQTISSTILGNPRHRKLHVIHDASVVLSVLNRALSVREDGHMDEPTKGGMGLMAQRFLTQTGGNIYLRSGAALIAMLQHQEPRVSRLDYGVGTQWRFEVPIG